MIFVLPKGLAGPCLVIVFTTFAALLISAVGSLDSKPAVDT